MIEMLPLGWLTPFPFAGFTPTCAQARHAPITTTPTAAGIGAAGDVNEVGQQPADSSGGNVPDKESFVGAALSRPSTATANKIKGPAAEHATLVGRCCIDPDTAAASSHLDAMLGTYAPFKVQIRFFRLDSVDIVGGQASPTCCGLPADPRPCLA